MAYRDPYAEQYARQQSNQPQFDSSHDFNPYPQQQPYQAYEQGPAYDNFGGGYRDDPHPDPHGQPFPSQEPTSQAMAGNTNRMDAPAFAKESSGFDKDAFTSRPRGGRTARDLRNYRYDFQGHLWTKGGRGRCVGRFCCCTLMIALFLIISIVLSLALWIRPPNISFGDVSPVTNGSTIQLQQDGVTINLGVNISVDNPNYFSADFKQIKAEISYPINNTAIGQGISNNVVFHSHSQTNFTFPFTINYKLSNDPNNKILVDLATKCGVIGGSKSNIVVDYKITLALRVLFVTISPVIANSFSFACPLDESDIEALLKSAGISASGLGGLLG